MRTGDGYVVNGRKMYISRVGHSYMMILLARTTPREQVERKSDGLSVFLFDLGEAIGNGLTVKPRRVMINNETNELLFEDLWIPASSLIGEEGRGFRYILDGMNAERVLISAEYDVERKFRETRLFQVAPLSTNLILSYVAEHVLGLPRSF